VTECATNTNEALPGTVRNKLKEGALVVAETQPDTSQSPVRAESSVVVAVQQKPSPKQVQALYVLAFTRSFACLQFVAWKDSYSGSASVTCVRAFRCMKLISFKGES
jgi:hypothetical protein